MWSGEKTETVTLEQLFQDKSIKAKKKVSSIGGWLLSGELPVHELLTFAEKQKADNKATCIESLEYATKKDPAIAEARLLSFVTNSLKDDEPRVKWESARVIGNIARLFPDDLMKPMENLLINARNPRIVVRWATAYALAEIAKLKTDYNKKLLPRLEELCKKEQDSGVKKKYLDAMKRVKK